MCLSVCRTLVDDHFAMFGIRERKREREMEKEGQRGTERQREKES